MRYTLLALLTFTFAFAHARTFTKGFVQIRPDQRLWVEQRKALNGKPTIVFLNGLTWSTREWQPLVEALDLLDSDLGIVLYDMQGMGETLLDKKPVTWDIPFDAQIRDLKSLITKLNLQGPKVLAGLSYGGAGVLDYLALYPDDFDKGIAMSPFLARLPDQDRWIRGMIEYTRQMQPWNTSTDDELYDFYLRQLVFTTYPSAEPVVLENPYKLEAVYRMVKGAKDFKAVDIATKLPKGKLHLMSGEFDPYVSVDWQRSFWADVPEKTRASFIVFRDTSHKLPQERPDFTAAWLLQIVRNNPDLQKGLTFDGDPVAGTAKSGDITIPMHQESFRGYILRATSKSL